MAKIELPPRFNSWAAFWKEAFLPMLQKAPQPQVNPNPGIPQVKYIFSFAGESGSIEYEINDVKAAVFDELIKTVQAELPEGDNHPWDRLHRFNVFERILKDYAIIPENNG